MKLTDDLIIKLLANRGNWHKLTLELANTKEYVLDKIDIALIKKGRWN